MHKYFAFIWHPLDPESARGVALLQERLLAAAPWALAYQSNGALVIHQPLQQRSPSTHLLANNQGAIIGSLYHRRDGSIEPRPAGDFDDLESGRILESGGLHLVRNYWGSYIAVVHDTISQASSLLRDPTGNLACYHAKMGRVHIFFSDLADFKRHIPMSLSVHWLHMTARLLNGLSLSRECSLHEIEDIPGGERITFGTEQESRTALWHPAKFCLEQGREDSAAAAEELRATVLGVIAALASEHEHILVLLSGGLDSSIVTSCLSRSPYHANVTCLNFYITGAGAVPSLAHAFPGVSHEDMAKLRRLIGNADEREFAQKVADKCGFKILNRERRVFTLSPRQVRAAPLAPRPSAYAFLLDQDEMECEAAAAARATACFTGQGGDSIFFATQRAIGALDYAYLHPLGARLIREIRSTVSLSRESLAHVVKKAIKYGYLRVALPSPFDPMTRPHLLRDEIARGVPNDYFHHPWIDTAPRLCPGKHNHVRAVATSVPAYDNVYHREKAAPSVYPFASQPIVEMCLRTPTYVLLENGTSRGLARRAFRDMLPPEVQKRTTKACGTALYQNVVRYNMPTIRESLLDGMLIRHNILDRRKLEHYLTAEQPFLTVQAEQVIDYLACESWLAQVY